MSQPAEPSLPLRIEMATSEVEGAETIAWADPEQVIACVAWTHPRDSFSRFILPRLSDLARTPVSEGAETPEGRLPARLRVVLERLRQAHGRILRDNRAGAAEPRVIRPVLMMVEEGRVYFIKGKGCWIFLLREGNASPVCVAERPDGCSLPSGLGQSDRLQLAVTSLDVRPNDVVVLLASEGAEVPDRRAIARVFEETQDLRRACDGFVNLLGLGPGGAGAVAVRFVPVGAARPTAGQAETLFEDLEREFRTDLGQARRPEVSRPGLPLRQISAPGVDEGITLPAFLEEIGSRESPPAVAPSDASDQSSPSDGPQPDPEPPQGEESVSAGSPGIEGADPSEPPRRPGRGQTGKALWIAAVGVVVTLMVVIVALPRGNRPLRGPQGAVTGGVLRVASMPPAKAIWIDGVDQRTGSPAVLEGIAPGVHQVRLDLGAFGSLEERVRLRAGESVDLRPRASGSLEVHAVDPRPEGAAWVEERPRVAVPCRFDTLPVGWHEIFYEDERVPLWERQVLIRAGETFRLRINNAFATDRALLKVESWIYRDGEGLREASGDSVYLDTQFAGVTPHEAEIAPGIHGVRVCGASAQTWTEVVEMPAGSSRVVAPRFGMGSWPRIVHQDPGRVVLRGPLLLTAQIQTPDGTPARNPRLHMPGLSASARDIPLSPVDPERGAFVGIVEPRCIPIGQRVCYYFTVQTASGETISSELYRLTVVSDVSEALSR